MYYLSVPRGAGLLDQQPKEEAQGPCLRRPSQKRLAGGSSLTSTKYAPFPLVPPVQELSAQSQLMTEPAKGGVPGILTALLLAGRIASFMPPEASKPIIQCHLERFVSLACCGLADSPLLGKVQSTTFWQPNNVLFFLNFFLG